MALCVAITEYENNISIYFADSYTRPSCALLSVIKQIPSYLLDDSMEAMIGNQSLSMKLAPPLPSSSQFLIQNHAEKEGRTVTAVQTMVEWLCERPSELLSDKLMFLSPKIMRFQKNIVSR